jgi:ATP-dependent RNA helicase DeaD
MKSFQELELSPQLMRAITDLGFEKPSPIQEQALPILLGDPTDFIGLAATGTGKTAAFSIPMLEKIDASKKIVQAIVLCPTRELALQVAGQIDILGKHLGVRSVPIYGGASYADQIRGLRSGACVVVGTPGRVVDHMTRGTLKLDKVEIMILDEADEMVSMGFKDELEQILDAVPRAICAQSGRHLFAPT